MGFAEAVDAPVVVAGVAFPRLTSRNLGVIAAKYKAATVAAVKSTISQDKGSDDAKLRFMLTNATASYGLEDVWAWSQSIDGANAIAVESLVQGGMTAKDADEAVAKLSALAVREVAMEVSEHPEAPSKKKQEGKKGENPTSGE